jgi:hypothetical protein
VFAKNPGNSNVPALRVLTADGLGGTYWAIPSTLGAYPAFNEIITSAGTYTADLSYNKFRLVAGEGIGMVNGPTGSNQTNLYAKAFNQFDISGGNSVYAFLNNQLDPTVTFAGENGIQLRADPATNTFYIGGSGSSNTFVSTGIYGFSQLKVTDATSSITSSVQELAGNYISANSPSTLLRFLGYNDIQLSTNVTTNSVYFTISTFTSEGYLNISNAAYSAYPSTLSTVSSLYVQTTTFVSSLAALSSSGVQWSSVQSSINALAISSGEEFYRLTGLINARATIVQLNANIAQVNSNIISTTQGLGSAGYISSGTGGGGISALPFISSYNVSTGFLTASSITLFDTYTNDPNSLTVSGATLLLNGSFVSGGAGGGGGAGVTKITAGTNISISPAGGLGNVTINSLSPSVYDSISTLQGLGSSGYLSSFSVITTSTIFNTGSISTYSLEVFGPATLTASGSTILRGAVYLAGPTYFAGPVTSGSNSLVLTENLVSSTKGLGSSGYISTSQLVSTTTGLQGEFTTAGFLSTTSLVSTTTGLQREFTTAGFLSTTSLVSTTTGLQREFTTAGFLSTPTLTSTTSGLQREFNTAGFISTSALISTTSGLQREFTTAGFLSSLNLFSTVAGLGTAGYISTAGGAGNVTTGDLRSTVVGLGTSGYISTAGGAGDVSIGNLRSTVVGLGSAGYISTPGLISTTGGLQREFTTAGFLSTLSLVSTTSGLQTSLLSTTGGLQKEFNTAGFLSTLSLVSTTSGLQTSLLSTTGGLQKEFNTAGFLSTLSLVSTTSGLQTSLLSTTGGLQREFNTAGFLSTPVLLSSVKGLGSAGYLSSLRGFVVSTGFITVSSVNLLDTYTNEMNRMTVSSQTLLLNGQFITGGAGGGGGAGVTQLLAGTNITLSPVGGTGVVTVTSLGVNGPNLVSTTTGLQREFNTAGFISTTTLISTTTGLQTSLISTTGGVFSNDASNFTSTVKGLGTLQYVSSPQLLSTVGGLQTSLISTTRGLQLSLFSTTGGIFANDASNFTSTVKGLGSLQYISSAQLLSTVGGLQISLVSTTGGLQGSLVSTTGGLQLSLVSTTGGLQTSLFSTTGGIFANDASNFTSTTKGLGTFGYISSAQLLSTVGGLQTYISSFIDPAELASSVLSFISLGFFASQLTSTTIGLGSLQYISSAQLLSTVGGLQGSLVSTTGGLQTSLISTTGGIFSNDASNFTSTVKGLGSLQYISSVQLLSTVGGLQTSLVSTTGGLQTSLVSTTGGLQTSLISTTGGIFNNDASNFTSTVKGLGTLQYISSAQLLSTVGGLQGSLVSTTGGLQVSLISTTSGIFNNDASNFTSTTKGLGSSGYISSLQLLSTTAGLQGSLISTTGGLQGSLISTTGGLQGSLISTTGGLQGSLISTTGGIFANDASNFTSTVKGLGTLQYISSAQLLSTVGGLQGSLVSTTGGLQVNLISTTGGLQGSLVSTTGGLQLSLFSTTGGLQGSLVSTTGGLQVNLISTTSGIFNNDASNFTSTVKGLGTLQYISSAQLLSTVGGLQTYISSFIDPSELASSVLSFISLGYFTTQLTSTTIGLGSLQYISSAQLLSTVGGLQGSLVSTTDGLQLSLFSTTGGLQTSLVSTTGGLQGSLVSTTGGLQASLFSTTSGLGTAGYVSSLTGMFTLTADTPANITFNPPLNTIEKIGNNNANDYVRSQERYPFCAVSFQPLFPVYDFQNVRLSRGTNLNYGISFEPSGVWASLNSSNTTQIGSFNPSNIDIYTLQLNPDNVMYYVNNSQVYTIGGPSNPVTGQYGLEFNLIKTGDILSNVSFAGTTSPNTAANSRLFFNTPTTLATNNYIQSALVSTTAGIGTPVNSAQLSNAVNRIIVSTLVIPYTTVPTNTAFQFSNSPSQLFFGSTDTTAQIYMGDLLTSLGNLDSNNPLLQIQQKSIFVSGASSNSYSFNGPTPFQVPRGITELSVQLYGAGGCSSSNAAGGAGGFVSGILPVIPGETLQIVVGNTGNTLGSSNAYLGGGNSGVGFGVGGGGGLSGIYRGTTPLVIVGAGGGGSGGTTGGNGGSATGQVGGGTGGGGGGGTQSAGGAAGGGSATAGGLEQGGNGSSGSTGGGGGGAGYYGGGGGADGDAGGGGSSYVSLLTTVTANTQGGGSATDVAGQVIVSWSGISYRPGNLLQIDNYLSRRFIVDPTLHTGINISSIDSRYYLDVSGGTRVSSLTLGTYATTGVLGTDATATNLFWNGVQVNGGGGGGDLTTSNLISTVQGLGTAEYISSSQLLSTTGGLQLSLLSTVEGLGSAGYISTASGSGGGGGAVPYISAFTVSTSFLNVSSISTFSIESQHGVFSTLFCYDTISTHTLSVYGSNTLVVNGVANIEGPVNINQNTFVKGYVASRDRVVFSTLGAEVVYINSDDLSTKFFLKGANSPQSVVLPDSILAGSGWSILIKNTGTFTDSALNLYASDGETPLGDIPIGTVSNIVSDGTAGRGGWYFY